MPTVLITGANRGLGLEFARQYAGEGWRVIATCRDPENAIELARLEGKVEIYALDIGDHGQILSLRWNISNVSKPKSNRPSAEFPSHPF